MSAQNKRFPAKGLFKIAAAVAVAVCLIGAARFVDIQESFRIALSRIQESGLFGMLLFFGLYVTACVFMLPGAVLTLGAGALFGVINGSILVSVSSTAGATAAFLAGRYLARDMVARRIEVHPYFRSIDEAVASEGWKIVGLTRLSPVFPFNLLNYAFGLTRVSLRDYILASWIGMIPGTVTYVYLGSLAGSLAELGTGAGERVRSDVEWALYGLGMVASVAVTVVVTRTARRELGRRIGPLPDRKEKPS